MAIMEISIIPVGTKTASVSKYVVAAIEMLKKEKGIRYTLTAMGTIVEAEPIERLLEIAGKMHSIAFDDKVKRVVSTIKIDERRDKKLTSKGKIDSVEEKLKRK